MMMTLNDADDRDNVMISMVSMIMILMYDDPDDLSDYPNDNDNAMIFATSAINNGFVIRNRTMMG